MNINPELSEPEFQEEHNTYELFNNNELKTNQSTFSDNNSSKSKNIYERESGNFEFGNISQNDSHIMVSDKNLVLSHISNNKCYSTHSNSQDCRSIMNQLENENKSSNTSEINFKHDKKKKHKKFEFGSHNNYRTPYSIDEIHDSNSTYNVKSKNNKKKVKILKPKYLDKETNLKIRFLENTLDITKFNSKNKKKPSENGIKSYNSNEEINENEFDINPNNLLRVTSDCDYSQSSKKINITEIKIEKNYFYESDTEKNQEGELKLLKIESGTILTPNFDSGEKEDTREEFENNSENKKNENECSLSFKSFKS